MHVEYRLDCWITGLQFYLITSHWLSLVITSTFKPHTNTHKKHPLLTYLLTYSMVQSSSWEANWFAASHEIPRISRNPKVRYRTHKRPPPISILGPPNPVHIPTSHLLEIHPNIIHPSTPRCPQGFLSLRKTPLEINFTYLNNEEIYYIFKTCCMTYVLFSTKCCLVHNFIFFFSNNTHIFHKSRAKI